MGQNLWSLVSRMCLLQLQDHPCGSCWWPVSATCSGYLQLLAVGSDIDHKNNCVAITYV